MPPSRPPPPKASPTPPEPRTASPRDGPSQGCLRGGFQQPVGPPHPLTSDLSPTPVWPGTGPLPSSPNFPGHTQPVWAEPSQALMLGWPEHCGSPGGKAAGRKRRGGAISRKRRRALLGPFPSLGILSPRPVCCALGVSESRTPPRRLEKDPGTPDIPQGRQQLAPTVAPQELECGTGETWREQGTAPRWERHVRVWVLHSPGTPGFSLGTVQGSVTPLSPTPRTDAQVDVAVPPCEQHPQHRSLLSEPSGLAEGTKQNGEGTPGNPLRRARGSPWLPGRHRKGSLASIWPGGPPRRHTQPRGTAPVPEVLGARAGVTGARLSTKDSRAPHSEGHCWQSHGDSGTFRRARPRGHMVQKASRKPAGRNNLCAPQGMAQPPSLPAP